MDTEQAGSASYPVKTIEYAIGKIKDEGVIYLKDSYTLEKNISAYGKKLIITGESLDVSKLGTFSINNDTEFSGNITVKFPTYVVANGHSFKIGEDVSVEGTGIQIYGGSTGAAVENTDVTVLSGTFGSIYGGGINGGNVTGNTKLTVAGNTTVSNIYGGGNTGTVYGNTQVYCYGNINKDLDITKHSNTRMVYGGSNNGTVNGNTYVNFSGNAKADLIHGAGNGASSVVNGKSTVEFVLGTAMGLYGGSSGGVAKDTYVVMTGGYVEQIFGGSNSAAVTGNTDVRVLGGTVKRRVYGGCYNDYSLTGWKSSFTVTGNTNVVFSSKVDFKNSDTDSGICAISRYKDNNSAEVATLILSDYNGNLDSKIGSSYFTFSGGAYDYLLKVSPNVEAYSSNGTVYFKACKAGTLSIKCGNNTESIAVNTSDTVTRSLSNFNSKDITVTLN